MNREKIIRLGTRGSILALAQAKIVEEQIIKTDPDITVELRIIKTSGDKITDRPLQEFGGKALFVKELEEALHRREIDLAVHSMKDMEMPLPDGLIIACVLELEDPRDVWISRDEKKLLEIHEKARVGTCSPRRAAQILSLRPDLEIVPLRGNIDTRLQKMALGACDATLLAYAGLKRIHYTEVITEILDPQIMIPAVAQGIIGIEVREEDTELQKILTTLNHQETEKQIHVESQLLQGFGGDCTTPVAGWSYMDATGDVMSLHGVVALPTGRKKLKKSLQGNFQWLSSEAYKLGQEFQAWYMMHRE